ncbi:sulfate ABC transporter substrate-binding protein [Cohnella sp. WQ 127256]|uniref:sulfate ABC transporter substrate-binding protein n=1 Tax=Cohnella sp. WQ 127256 TaxID=2938790 RepID=UPI0021197049|nr:sulfate ABC transporter substrate-binding protein [Cohnella sp. WQ 127256]
MKVFKSMKVVVILLSTIALIFGSASPAVNNKVEAAAKKKKITLLNVSYDPTRELYEEFNKSFATYWKKKTGQVVEIKQSHGGSGKQARSVVDGLKADVVTLALSLDIGEIQNKGLIDAGWENKLPYHSSPYTSTIVFVVRKGNPKGIKDWDDIVKSDVQIITPNPKTGGAPRWTYLAAWAYALKHNKNSEDAAREFVTKLYKNVPVLDTGARGSTTTFAQRGIGDVLLTWENEAHLIQKEFGKDYEIITPSLSILAEPSVAVVTKNAKKNETTEVANEYLKYLYTKEGQRLVAKHYYRPNDPAVLKEFAKQFPKLELVTIRDFGGWAAAQKKHFADNGIFDQIYQPQ